MHICTGMQVLRHLININHKKNNISTPRFFFFTNDNYFIACNIRMSRCYLEDVISRSTQLSIFFISRNQ